MSRNEGQVIHLKETYKFCFDRVLIKRTVFILIKKMLLKIKSYGFRPNNTRYEKVLRSKIVHLKKIYNFDFDHFLIKCTVFVLIVKNVIKNQKFNFPDKLLRAKRADFFIYSLCHKKVYGKTSIQMTAAPSVLKFCRILSCGTDCIPYFGASPVPKSGEQSY